MTEAAVLKNLGVAYRHLGRLELAHELHVGGVAVVRRRTGPDPVALCLADLAADCCALGRFVEARGHLAESPAHFAG